MIGGLMTMDSIALDYPSVSDVSKQLVEAQGSREGQPPRREACQKSSAAACLGLKRTTLLSKMARLDIVRQTP
jgi:hypothetical protein